MALLGSELRQLVKGGAERGCSLEGSVDEKLCRGELCLFSHRHSRCITRAHWQTWIWASSPPQCKTSQFLCKSCPKGCWSERGKDPLRRHEFPCTVLLGNPIFHLTIGSFLTCSARDMVRRLMFSWKVSNHSGNKKVRSQETGTIFAPRTKIKCTNNGLADITCIATATPKVHI